MIVIPEQWENMSPVVMLEAISAKKKIGASKIGGIPEFLKEHLVEPTDYEGFAEEIIKCLN